jgi:hypothetical protein
MKNRLIIGELSYLHDVTADDIVGGDAPVAITQTIATTAGNSPTANASASATGQYIGIDTQSEVKQEPTFSIASALATAYAITGNSAAFSLSLSKAITIKSPFSGSQRSISFNVNLNTTI